ncbi:MAG: RidA family protein [Rubrobacter sp.]|nr:RidA family protein [Rubrobacter sp.]MDQ3378648.1 RidA family protein [Actinomycetota bacterium]
MTPTARLRELGLELPPVATPAGSYVPATQAGPLVFTAGQLPLRDGEIHRTGKVGDAVTPEEAKESARLCALNALAAAAERAGGLDNLRDVVKVTGFVASAPGFNGQPGVLNGASELLGEVFGEAGLHARSAVGVAELPLDAPVEVELIVSLDPPA